MRQLLGYTSGLPDIVDQNGSISADPEAAAWQLVKARLMDAPVDERFDYHQTNGSRVPTRLF